MSLLTFLIVAPLVGSILIGILGRRPGSAGRVALVSSLIVFVLSLLLWVRFDPSQPDYQFVESYRWIPSLGVSFLVGIDGVSLFMVLLTTFLTPLAVLASWDSIEEKTGAFYVLILILESLMLGVFIAIDVFLFYVFWEAMLIPMYLLIGVWGGERRIYAAIKFFLFTMGGSILMLVAIIYCYHVHDLQSGGGSFDLRLWQGLVLGSGLQRWLFLAFFAAFAVKIPLVPLHPPSRMKQPTRQ